jgi:hypothetical protein
MKLLRLEKRVEKEIHWCIESTKEIRPLSCE